MVEGTESSVGYSWLAFYQQSEWNKKGFMSKIKELESSLNIFSPDFKLLWVFRKSMPNKIALHVAALDTQMKISFVAITAANTTAIVLAHH